MAALHFDVTPDAFYALGALLPMAIGADQRYVMATNMRAEQVESRLTDAMLGGIIATPPAMSAAAAAAQMGRRLVALGTVGAGDHTLHLATPYPEVSGLIGDWLAYSGDDAGLWPWLLGGTAPHHTTNPKAQVLLVLAALTGWDNGPTSLNGMDTALDAQVPLTDADVIAGIDAGGWTAFFTAHPAYLPVSTLPGSNADRIAAFLRLLAKFYTVAPLTIPLGGGGSIDHPALLDRHGFDPIARFVASAGVGFTFGAPLTDPAGTAALVFPGDEPAQAWLVEAVTTVNTLWTLTTGVIAAGPANAGALQFSLVEALFSRGFTTAEQIAALSFAEFLAGLTGTVACRPDWAKQIWLNAGGAGTATPPEPGFHPVDADGDLVNCIPPPELSPLGPVEYLSELIHTGLNATCDDTVEASAASQLGTLIALRRGDVATLLADRANLSTPLPVIDLVNECLEYLAARVAAGAAPLGGGVVHDTEPADLDGHPLRQPGVPEGEAEHTHDPARLFAALPQYSSPHVPVAGAGAYTALATDFSSPALPYDQATDVSRTYLESLGTSRFQTLRRFRSAITEFVLSPANQAPGADPTGFDATRWRHPVRADIAREYLGITAAEDTLLYGTPIVLSGAPVAGSLLLRVLYGFAADDTADDDGTTRPWLDEVVVLAEFLERTGLAYCDFLDLWRCGFVQFQATGVAVEGVDGSQFPECPPCYLDRIHLAFPDEDPSPALARLAVFIRLWHRLRHVHGAGYSFAQLADIATVLGLFDGAGNVNPGFIRQLAAFQMLRDLLRLPLHGEHITPGATGSARTQLLALWDGSTTTPQWRWAVGRLLDSIEDHAEREHGRHRRGPEFITVLAANLDALSLLAGFAAAPATDTWFAAPTHTLRLAEVLAKLVASAFTTGDLVVLLTADDHLDGDDPFELPDVDESLDHPLDLPDDDHRHSLHRLRRQLLAAEVDDAEVERWTWRRIDACLRSEFGYTATSGSDPLTAFAAHFFPQVLEEQGHTVTAADRRYSTPLSVAATSPHMWNADDESPFHYDAGPGGGTEENGGAGTLWIEIPLRDQDVLETIAELRQLHDAELRAVQDLYFQPRVALAGLGLVLGDLSMADRHLVQEADHRRRWRWFVRQFLLARRRCRLVAGHLARHVEAVCAESPDDKHEHEHEHEADGDRDHATERAWLVLRHLAADENWPAGGAAWEDDGGAVPALTWDSPLVGRALQALLGLCGTGLLTELRVGGVEQWRDVSGPLDCFGHVRDEWNAPLPTLLPGLDLHAQGAQTANGVVRNGLGFTNDDGALVGGASSFEVSWTGVLLVEESGTYRFHAAFPDDDDEQGRGDDGHGGRHWRLELRRGQRRWTVLERGGQPEPDLTSRSAEVALRAGAYDVEAHFSRPAPTLRSPEAAGRARTGFAIQYCGPDTGGELVVIPHSRLFIASKDGPLGPWWNTDTRGKLGALAVVSNAAEAFLAARYTSTLRDIRRTYQRAFKGVLLARHFELSAVTSRNERQSELGYMLEHPDRFTGTAYYRDSGDPAVFDQHLADFDLDFLPILDPYRPPTADQDDRTAPSVQRRQALMDWWERLFGYTQLRRANREAVRPPLWQLFQDASDLRPTDPPPLTPHMDIDLDHSALVTTFLGRGTVTAGDLLDERWAQRVSEAERWAQQVQRHAGIADIGLAQPSLWVEDDPSVVLPPAANTSGNADLTGFVQTSCLESGRPRRYADLQAVNDQLRLRARTALLAYLCGMDRVPLPAAWATPFARRARDLSDLLLIDVEVGLCERVTRIEDAAGAVHALVQRIRLGLEPPLVAGDEFVRMWDATFAGFRTWQACRRRLVYRENWIEWEEMERARREEGYRFLENLLRRHGLDTPLPAGLQYWTGTVAPPGHPGLPALQVMEPSTLAQPLGIEPPPADAAVPTEGFGLMGIPDAGGSPTWLAPLPISIQTAPPGDNVPGEQQQPGPIDGPRLEGGGPAIEVRSLALVTTPGDATAPPLWIEAAIRLGTRFLRVAAAGLPSGSALLEPRHHGAATATGNGGRDGQADDCRIRGCCTRCGTVHPPVVDEYYFWLAEARTYDLPPKQEANLTPRDPSLDSAWEDPTQAPSLLEWSPTTAVTLQWCRVHNGEFGPPRRCSDVVELKGDPTLQLLGRVEDSLVFRVDGGEPPQTYGGEPSGTYTWSGPYETWTADPGFRYDLAVDDAVALPVVSKGVKPSIFAGLPAYPFFVYGEPGAPLIPWSAFAPAVAVADALRAQCRYHAALRWYDLVFDPMHGDNTWSQCPQAKPNPPTSPPGMPAEPTLATEGQDVPAPVRSRTARRRDLVDPPAPSDAPVAPAPATGDVVVAEGPPRVEACCQNTCPTPAVARHRAITLSVLDTLVQLADASLTANSPEAFARARVALAAASRILGAPPQTIVLGPPAWPQKVGTFTPSSAPLNPRLLSLYERVEDLLGLLHRCDTRPRLRQGRERDADGWWTDDPSVDGWRVLDEDCDCDAGACRPGSPYRFTFLVQRALELAGEVRSLGAALLGAIEKGDAEYLSSLRAAQEHQLLQLGLSVRKDQWRDADWQVQALRIARQSAQAQVAYYSGLLLPPPLGLNSGETTYQSLTEAAMGVQIASQVLETIGQVGAMMPDVFADGVATGVTVPGIGKKFTAIFHTLASAMGFLAQDLTSDAGLNLTEAGWQRRQIEWLHQIDIYTIEIEHIKRQILGAERRASQALKELDNQQRQIENTAELEDFLRDRFSSDALYLFLQRHTMALYRQMYGLAVDAARLAERAFNYERGHTSERFIACETWDRLHEGLLAGERLDLGLRRMDKAHCDRDRREYELTKHLSLRIHFPEQFLRLKETGCCELQLPEWMFDLDYPGQYMRRIKSVSLTIPAVVGPYTGVHCRLTLLSSATRVDPRLASIPTGCCDDADRPDDGYQAVANDPRVVRTYGATQAIATSSGQNDSGLFELSFRDERYLPFELAGAVSRWCLDMPLENNQFDFDSLSDVLLHLNYTAREGGTALRDAAAESARTQLPGGGVRLFDIRHDMPDQWNALRASHGRRLGLVLSRSMFPFVQSHHGVLVRRLELFVEAGDDDPGAHRTARYVPRHSDGDDRHGARGQQLHCVAVADLPALLHGVVDTPVGPVCTDNREELGAFEFEEPLATVRRAFLIAHYDVEGDHRGRR